MMIEENLQMGPKWLFDIDSLTISMNYELVTTGNQSIHDAGKEIYDNAGQAGQEKASNHEHDTSPCRWEKIVVNEASIRRDLRLDDAEGTACLPNVAIFEELARTGVITPLFATMMVQAPEEVGEIPTDAQDTPILTQPSSSQPKESTKLGGSKGRKQRFLKMSNQLRNISLQLPMIHYLVRRMIEEDLFRVHDLSGDEVFVDVTIGDNIKQDATIAEKEISTTNPVTTAGEVVTVVEDVKVGAAATILQISKDEVTLDQTLMLIKAAKPKAKGVTIQELSEFRTTSSSQPPHPPQAKDNEVARKLEAEMKAKMEEEERIAREKEKANIAMITEWDNTHAIMDVDYELAAKLQDEEIGELTIKGKSFKEVQQAFNKTMYWVNNFVAMDFEVVKDRAVESSKRVGKELEQESAKTQNLDEQIQADDDTLKLKRCLEIVPEDDDDVKIEATSLSSKSPTIDDYKIYREGKKSYFKIIRAYGNSQNYLTFRKMFKNFNREDLEVLRSIVKERFKKTMPVDDMDNLLFQTLKTMFEHHIKDNIWKYHVKLIQSEYPKTNYHEPINQ
nr:hypothetical protein [Tanacetum cinerariifolium]